MLESNRLLVGNALATGQVQTQSHDAVRVRQRPMQPMGRRTDVREQRLELVVLHRQRERPRPTQRIHDAELDVLRVGSVQRRVDEIRVERRVVAREQRVVADPLDPPAHDLRRRPRIGHHRVRDARQPLDGVIGYEGNDEIGFLPADNGVYWFGDAGISASLDDMLAWEVHIDATRNAPKSLYNRLAAPVTYADGTPADYGYGLRRDSWSGVKYTSHGGGLRGFSSYRLHAAEERLSVVVMFNHDTATFTSAISLMEATLGLPPRANEAVDRKSVV